MAAQVPGLGQRFDMILNRVAVCAGDSGCIRDANPSNCPSISIQLVLTSRTRISCEYGDLLLRPFELQLVAFPVFSQMWRIFARGLAVNTDIMTIKELAEYLKITEKTAYRLVATGELPGFKVGGSWRFRLGEIDRWIDRQSVKPKGESTG